MDAKSDPVEIFKRNPRVTCLIPRNSEEWKEYRKMRVSSERVFSRVKTYSPRAMFYGLERITVHVTLICITMCAIASVWCLLRPGVPNLRKNNRFSWIFLESASKSFLISSKKSEKIQFLCQKFQYFIAYD